MLRQAGRWILTVEVKGVSYRVKPAWQELQLLKIAAFGDGTIYMSVFVAKNKDETHYFEGAVENSF